jgi:hypothetical protein
MWIRWIRIRNTDLRKGVSDSPEPVLDEELERPGVLEGWLQPLLHGLHLLAHLDLLLRHAPVQYTETLLQAVMRIQDVYPGYEFFPSRIPDPHQKI